MTSPAMARTPDRQSPLPLWVQVRDDLLRRLRGGAFEREVPGELVLMREYGVSRYTVREALRRLRESGLLESRRGMPTRVSRVEQPLGGLYSLFRSVEGQGMTQRSQVLRQELVVDAAAAAALEVDPDTELLHVERIRYADDEPLAHDLVWLPADLARPLLAADLSRTALYDELARQCGVEMTGGSEQIRAVQADPALRALLELPAGIACLEIERQGVASVGTVEHRLTTVRGDRYSLTATWAGGGVSLDGTRPR